MYADSVSRLVQVAAGCEAPACVLMYGQTGSGKTFTMRAIMKAAAAQLFATARGATVSLSYAELGGGGARDMLNSGAPAQLLTDRSGEVQLVPSVEVEVASAAGLLALLDYASSIRATAATWLRVEFQLTRNTYVAVCSEMLAVGNGR